MLALYFAAGASPNICCVIHAGGHQRLALSSVVFLMALIIIGIAQ